MGRFISLSVVSKGRQLQTQRLAFGFHKPGNLSGKSASLEWFYFMMSVSRSVKWLV